MAFRDLLPSYFDDDNEDAYGDGYDAPAPVFRDKGQMEDMRRAVQETAPEAQSWGERLLRGGFHDIQELGHALGAPIYYGARELYRTVQDPAAQAEKYGDLIEKVSEDPYGTAERLGGAVVDALAEPYRRKPGEGVTDVVARNVLDRPLGTLMDLSAVVGLPAGLAERAGVTGAKVFADAARHMDPLTIANKALTGAMKTKAPDALARMEASRAITDLAAAQKTRQTAIHAGFQRESAAIFEGLAPEEKALFFPYVEGRLKAITEGPETGVLQELTPEGMWTPRGVDPAVLGRLAEARDRYLPLVDTYEQAMGWAPEQYAQGRMAKLNEFLVKNGEDPLAPHNQEVIRNEYWEAHKTAEERQQMRRTLSTRTSLDVQKEKQFAAEVERIKLEKGAAAAEEYASRYPVRPTTPQEAMEVWGPQGGLYFPHSGEVFTRDQMQVGQVLTKLREAAPWKRNAGSMYRTGALETMDPEKALLRTSVALRGGVGRAEILDELGKRFGQQLEPGYKFGTDPDFRAGTHQLMRPGLLHQDGALGESMNDLLQILMRNGDDPAVANMNIAELAEKAAGKIDQTFPLRKDAPVYKIRKGTADAIANWSRSLEPSTNPATPWLDGAADPFNFVTLNLRPARIVNNVVGNTLFQVLEGVHPFSTTGIGAISDMVRAVGYKAGLTKSEGARKLAQVFDLPGVRGGLSGAQDYTSRTATFLKGHPIAKLLGGKQLAQYGETMGRVNEHVENTARALSTLFELRKQSPGLLGRMASSAKTTMDLGDRLEALAAKGVGALDDADYTAALKNVNRFLNDYGRTSPLERTVLRRVFPYEKFYRHAIELALRTPFEQPAKMAVLRTIGKAARQDFEETLDQWGFDPTSMVLPWQRESVPIDVQQNPETGEPFVRLLNLQGPSPFSLLAASGDPGQEALGAVHPLIKAGLESALGINLFTLKPFAGPGRTFSGKEIDPFTGQVEDATARPGPIAAFAKQFFPVQLARDLLAGTRQPLDAASLLDQFRADFDELPGRAYKLDERGQPIERPKANPFTRLFVPVPQFLEAPTADQMRAQKATITEAYRKLGRARPDLAETLRERRRAAAEARREREAAEGRPYRVRPRRD